MTYRELTMIDVHEVLRRWTAGHSARKISRESGADRKTVGRYLAVVAELGLARETEWTESVLHEVAQRVQARPPTDPSEERLEIAAHRLRIQVWLEQKRPLRLRKIHTLLVRDHGVRASYHTLRRFALDEFGWHKKQPTVLVSDGKPGEEAQVDFGLMGTLHDPDTGRLRKLHALIVTLAVSRYQFVWPTFAQTTEAVCEGLDAAWRFFAAMARVLVPDNMSAMISTADPLAPTLVAAFQDYVQARGLFVDPARVRAPKDKGRVENQVAFVRESWFGGVRDVNYISPSTTITLPHRVVRYLRRRPEGSGPALRRRARGGVGAEPRGRLWELDGRRHASGVVFIAPLFFASSARTLSPVISTMTA